MWKNITYGQIRNLLTGLGFQEIRGPKGFDLKHPESDTIFLFRPYRETDPIKPAEVYHVRQMLDARNLLDADAFDGLLLKAPA